MLDRLVASHPERAPRGTALSALVAALLHGGLIVGAVVATLPPPPRIPPRRIVLDLVVPYVPTLVRHPAGTGRPALPAVRWAAPDVSDLRLPEPVNPDVHPDPGPADPWVMPRAGSGGLGQPDAPGSGGWEPGAAPGAVYRTLTVDEPPRLLTHPVLEYPPLLRSAGVEGSVVLEVVIDSAGRPEPGSLRVLEASHPLFVSAGTRALLGSRFRPGRIQGRPVRVLIRQPVVFRLAR